MSDETRPGETAVDSQIEKLLTDAESGRRGRPRRRRAKRSIARRR